MAVLPWAEIVFCNPDHVTGEVRNIESLISQSIDRAAREDGEIQKAIAWVKENKLRQKILREARRIFSQSNPHVAGIGWESWLQLNSRIASLDSTLDIILNPEELRPYAVILVIEKLFIFGETAVRMHGYGSEYRTPLADWIAREKVERWTDGSSLLQFDLSGDGIAQESERAKTGYRFFRV